MRALMGSTRLLVMGLAVVALSAAPVAQASGGTDTGGSSSTSGGGTGGGQTLPSTGAAPCATVTYSLSTSALVYYGTATFTTTVTSCSTADEALDISYAPSANDSAMCKSSLGTWSDTVTLRPGETRTLSSTKYTPYCFSTDSVTATVTASDGTVLASANTLGSTTNGGKKKGGLGGL
jgi:hypothetical protein